MRTQTRTLYYTQEDGAWTELLVAHAQAVQQHAQRLVLGKEAEPSTAEVSA